MRDIKFRAWDKERKDMREVQLMDWSDWWVSTGHTWERENGLEYGERNSFKNEETDRHTLMQYTGLKDKNGVEIYESDLLKVTITNYATRQIIAEKIAAVSYRGCKYGVDWPDGFTGLDEYSASVTAFEVIGNIYTHPELLEEAK